MIDFDKMVYLTSSTNFQKRTFRVKFFDESGKSVVVKTFPLDLDLYKNALEFGLEQWRLYFKNNPYIG
jgi:hypothetical protein